MISPQLLHLRELVEKLTYDGDNLALDKQLAEIDLVIYNIRQECFPDWPEQLHTLDKCPKDFDLGCIVDEISASITQESKSEDHSACNDDIDF